VDLKPEMFVCFVVLGSLYVCGYVSNLQALGNLSRKNAYPATVLLSS